MTWFRPPPPPTRTRPPVASQWALVGGIVTCRYAPKNFSAMRRALPMGSKIEHPTYGRPRLVSPEYESPNWPGGPSPLNAWGEGTTLRHGGGPERSSIWICPDGCHATPCSPIRQAMQDLKWSMLSELGRIEDEESVRAVARIVGRQRLPTARATALIRASGSAIARPPPDRLTRGLWTVIATHWARYPTTSEAEIVTALRSGSRGRSSGFLRLRGTNPAWTGNVRQLRGDAS